MFFFSRMREWFWPQHIVTGFISHTHYCEMSRFIYLMTEFYVLSIKVILQVMQSTGLRDWECWIGSFTTYCQKGTISSFKADNQISKKKKKSWVPLFSTVCFSPCACRALLKTGTFFFKGFIWHWFVPRSTLLTIDIIEKVDRPGFKLQNKKGS